MYVYMYVCMYVCIYVCMYVYMYVCMYVLACVRKYVYIARLHPRSPQHFARQTSARVPQTRRSVTVAVTYAVDYWHSTILSADTH